jgi:hypothetical protein
LPNRYHARPEPWVLATGRALAISLICPPEVARERLRRLEQLGFDDALLVCPANDPAQLETIRTLMECEFGRRYSPSP